MASGSDRRISIKSSIWTGPLRASHRSCDLNAASKPTRSRLGAWPTGKSVATSALREVIAPLALWPGKNRRTCDRIARTAQITVWGIAQAARGNLDSTIARGAASSIEVRDGVKGCLRRKVATVAEAALAEGDPDGLPAGEQDRLVEALSRRLVRMALDVHDGPMQELVAAGYALAGLRQRLTTDPSGEAGAIVAAVDQVCGRLATAEQGLRSVMFALEHGAERLPLREAVAGVVAAARAETRAGIELTFRGEVEAATDSQRIALTQVVRESLANAIRHGDPRRIEVRLCGSDQTLLLEVRDDGRGFDPETLPATSLNGQQVGIVGMRERLRLLGGDLTIKSRPGGPTTVSARVEKWQPGDRDSPEEKLRKIATGQE